MFSKNEIKKNNSNELLPISNGILRLYHQHPRFYPDFNTMINQISHIGQVLQCNAVWLGPIQQTSKIKVKRKGKAVTGSLYAMRSEKAFEEKLSISEDKLIAYTAKCEEQGVIPIFDLVLNQVAADKDSPIIKKFGRENFISKPIWDDTLWFDYQNKEFARHVIDSFWKPFIKQYISVYRFQGVRIDAVKHIAETTPEVLKEIIDFTRECCLSTHSKEPIILAELLDSYPSSWGEKLEPFNFSHILNSTFESFYSQTARKNNRNNGWNNENWLLHEIGVLQKVIYNTSEKQLRTGLGGTIGYVGNHDKLALGNALNELIKNNNSTSKDEVECAKEFIFGVAFTSDAGWYLLAGDEFYPKSKSYKDVIVFNDCLPLNWPEIKKNDKLCAYIGSINYCLSQLTPTAFPYWVEHKVIENCPINLGLAIRHVSKPEINEIICINLTNQFLGCNSLKKWVQEFLKKESTLKIDTIYLIDSGEVQILNAEFEENKQGWKAPKELIETALVEDEKAEENQGYELSKRYT